MKTEDSSLLNTIAQAIFDKKGFNILALDVRAVSTMTDYILIAEGSVDRHVKSLYFFIKDQLAAFGLKPFHVEGINEGDWIVLDYGSIMIHLFVPELREKYALEDLWNKAKIIDVAIVLSELSSPNNRGLS